MVTRAGGHDSRDGADRYHGWWLVVVVGVALLFVEWWSVEGSLGAVIPEPRADSQASDVTPAGGDQPAVAVAAAERSIVETTATRSLLRGRVATLTGEVPAGIEIDVVAHERVAPREERVVARVECDERGEFTIPVTDEMRGRDLVVVAWRSGWPTMAASVSRVSPPGHTCCR